MSDELKAMLHLAFERGEEEEPSAPNPTESQEVKPIRRGRLPKKTGETGQVPIIAGLLDGEVSRLRVDAKGAWTLEPREGAFAGKPVGKKAKNVTERFIVTRDDGATCRLTITLKITEKMMRTKGGPIEPTKRAVYVREKLSSWRHKRHPIRRREKLDNRARAMAFIRMVDEVEHFEEPVKVPLRAQGQLGINQPLVWLTFDDIRIIEFNIEDNESFGDGRKFVGLRFFNAAERLPVDETKGSDKAAVEPRSQATDDKPIEPADASLPKEQEYAPGRKKPTIKPRRHGGRKKGSGSLAAKDEPLLKLMKPLIADGTSDWAAAMSVVTKAAGTGVDESKAKRLVARFREWEKNNSV